MAEQQRSADRLVTLATSSADQIEKLKTDPVATLLELSKQATKELPLPDPPTVNYIWIIVVTAFAIVMVGSAVILGVGVFFNSKDFQGITKPDTILVLFTTVVGFLAGLLSPSPVGKNPS